MTEQKFPFIVLLFFAFFLFQNCGNPLKPFQSDRSKIMDDEVEPAISNSLLHNPNLKFKSGLTLVKINQDTIGNSVWFSDFSEAHLTSMPLNGCKEMLNGYGQDLSLSPITSSENESCASYYTDTRVGWLASDLNKSPGWSIWNLAGGNGVPLELSYLNHAVGTSDNCKLREIGLVLQSWSYAPHSQFRRQQDGSVFQLGDFNKVNVVFDAKMDLFNEPTCIETPTAKITADFRLIFRDSSQNIVKGYIISVLVYGMNGRDVFGNNHENPNEPVYFMGSHNALGHETEMVQYHGNKISNMGYPVDFVDLNFNSYTRYEIDFKEVFRLYIEGLGELPTNFTINDAEIDGLDIYTSTQGGDIDFTLKNVDILGL